MGSGKSKSTFPTSRKSLTLSQIDSNENLSDDVDEDENGSNCKLYTGYPNFNPAKQNLTIAPAKVYEFRSLDEDDELLDEEEHHDEPHSTHRHSQIATKRRETVHNRISRHATAHDNPDIQTFHSIVIKKFPSHLTNPKKVKKVRPPWDSSPPIGQRDETGQNRSNDQIRSDQKAEQSSTLVNDTQKIITPPRKVAPPYVPMVKKLQRSPRPQLSNDMKKFEIPAPRPPPCPINDENLRKYAESNCPSHLLPKGCYFKPAWDDTPPLHSKPKLRPLPPLPTDDPCDDDENANGVIDPCTIIYHAQTILEPIDLSQFPPKFSLNSKMKRANLGQVETLDVNANNLGHLERGDKDINGNFGQQTANPLKFKDQLNKLQVLRKQRDGTGISSATTVSSMSPESKTGSKSSGRSKRSQRSEVKGSHEVISFLEAKKTFGPPSEYYETSSVPTSRQNQTRSSKNSLTSSTNLNVMPRLVNSEQPAVKRPLFIASSLSTSTSNRPGKPILDKMDDGVDTAPVANPTVPIPETSTGTGQDPIPEEEASEEDFGSIDVPVEDSIPEEASEDLGSTDVPVENPIPEPTASTGSAEKSEATRSSKSSSSKGKSKSSSSGTTKSSSSSSKTSKSSKVISEKSAIVPIQASASRQKGNDPCDCFPPLNYAYCPPRSNAFVAPLIKLRDMEKNFSAQVASSDYAKELEDDGSVNFAFRPRPDYGTQVTFSVEPKKAPIWKTMLRCGFVPVINCGVPPCCLSQNMQSGSDSSDYSDSYDSYDTGDEYDYSSGSSSEHSQRRSSMSGSKSGSGSQSTSTGGSSGSRVQGSSGSKGTKSGSQSGSGTVTSGGSKSSGVVLNTKNKSKPPPAPAPLPEPSEPCETCDTDNDSVTVTVNGSSIQTAPVTETGSEGDMESNTADAKTIGVVDI